MALLRTDFTKVMPGLKNDGVRINETLGALSLREGERYISLGIGENLLPLIIAMQGVSVTGVDIDPEVLRCQTQNKVNYAEELRRAHGHFDVYNFNFDNPVNGTKPIPGFAMPDYDEIKNSFDIVECVYFNHREGEADLAQILLNLAKSDARFFVSAPGGHIGPLDRTAQALIKEIASKSDRPRLEVVATGLYVSTQHSHHYGVVLRPNS